MADDVLFRNPEEDAGFFSRLVFWWITPLIKLGYSRTLNPSDLPPLHSGKDRAAVVCEKFDRMWAAEEVTGNPSLFRALRRTFGFQFFLGGCLKFLNDLFQFAAPIIMGQVIQWLQASRNGTLSADASEADGLRFVALLFFTQLLLSICSNHYFNIVMRIGMHIRAAMISAIYRKTLRLNNKAMAEGTGKISNLVSTDSDRLRNLLFSLHLVWSSPFQVIGCLVLLIRLMGWPALTGLVIMLILIPIQAKMARQIGVNTKNTQVHSDARVKLVNEVLNGARVIKFYAWEQNFVGSVRDVRERELGFVRTNALWRAFMSFVMMMAPLLVSLSTFIVYAAAGYSMDAAIIFPAVSLFGILRFPVGMFPNMINQLVEAKLSLVRIESHLKKDENEPVLQHPTGFPPERAITIQNGNFTWGLVKKDKKPEEKGKGDKQGVFMPVAEASAAGAEAPLHLKDINFTVNKGQLVMVIGPVGAGKSSLLHAILGEIEKKRGDVYVDSTISYVAQQAWIMNATLKENVIFGHELYPDFYQRCVQACALQADLAILPAGDQTEIGERGINLSGGQKQRVSIARAVYNDAEMVLLDDPLSAVDAHVGQHIFEECIMGELRGKTRVLVTHQLQFLDQADLIYVMDKGAITASGSYPELLAKGLDFHTFIGEHKKEESKNAEVKDEKKKGPAAGHGAAAAPAAAAAAAPKKDVLVKEEKREEGAVKKEVVLKYFSAAGGVYVMPVIVLLQCVSVALTIFSDTWLAVWAENRYNETTKYYMSYFALFAAIAMMANFSRNVMFALASLRASRELHDNMLTSVIRAPMSFYDTTPVGRIINRFAKDTAAVDSEISATLVMFLNISITALGTMLLMVVITPYLLFPMVPLLSIYVYVQKYYRPTSRELKRLESISKSPIFAHFGETLSGVVTLRAYGAQDRFYHESERRVDANHQAYWNQIVSNRWLAVRLELMGMLIVVSLACLFVATAQSLDPGMAGLSLSYAMSLTTFLSFVVRQLTDSEAAMNSVERLVEYADSIAQEKPAILPDSRPPSNWPPAGAITLKNVTLCYREGLPAVLHQLSLAIRGGEKIGVVGRTGSGKSTLMLALFRLVELSEGSIEIDNIDIASIGLDDLRNQLAIIPQEPVLFSGTIRSNLDPFHQCTEQQLWEALDNAYMKNAVLEIGKSTGAGLDVPVLAEGANFSVGQRQLICLARALLRPTRILVMDEATAAVDTETDRMIQETVRKQFSSRTVLTIAHRLNTIMDNDRILVLDHGHLAEFDRPLTLLDNPRGVLTGMVDANGPAMGAYLRGLASGQVDVTAMLNAPGGVPADAYINDDEPSEMPEGDDVVTLDQPLQEGGGAPNDTAFLDDENMDEGLLNKPGKR